MQVFGAQYAVKYESKCIIHEHINKVQQTLSGTI